MLHVNVKIVPFVFLSTLLYWSANPSNVSGVEGALILQPYSPSLWNWYGCNKKCKIFACFLVFGPPPSSSSNWTACLVFVAEMYQIGQFIHFFSIKWVWISIKNEFLKVRLLALYAQERPEWTRFRSHIFWSSTIWPELTIYNKYR